MDNYLVQMKMAQQRFLTYDQEALIRKLHLDADEDFLYIPMLGSQYRLCRRTGSLEREESGWQDANTFHEVMVLLDVLCDSKDDRHLSGRWQSILHFGQMFHRGLVELEEDPLATAFDQKPGLLEKVCLSLGGRAIPGGDEAYAVPLMDDLEIGIFFWHGDEEFPAQLRCFWDANAHMYIRYETMHYALGLLQQQLAERSLHFP